MRGIVKRFPGVLANDHVDFELGPGEVHALLGENGAGKSTLMNILAGLYQPDGASISVRGQPRPVRLAARRHRGRAGHGPPALHAGALADRHREHPAGPGRAALPAGPAPVRRRDRASWPRVRSARRPAAKVWQLSVGEQQRVEILKMLYRGARVLIMDEPTAVLAPQEVEELFKTLRAMTAARRVHRLHQPQAGRGAGHRGPHHGHAPRQGHRRRAAGGRRDQGGAGQADGRRGRCSSIAKEPLEPGPVVLEVEGVTRRKRQAACRPCAMSRSTCAPARSWAWPAWPATARPSWPRSSPVCGRAHGGDRDQRRGRRQSPAIDGHPQRGRPHPGGPDTGWAAPRPVDHRQPDDEELPRASQWRAAGPDRHQRGAPERGVGCREPTTSQRPIDRHPGAAAIRRQPAAAHPRPRDRAGPL